MAALHHRCGVELDDLMQEAYLAMLRAVRLWRSDGGTGFIGIYELTLRTAFADVCGLRTMRNRNDPLQTAVSLDTPVGEDGEETNALVDFVQDTQAEDRLLEIEREELVEAVQAALQQLPNELRETLINAFWFDRPVNARLRDTAQSAQKARSLPNAADVCLRYRLGTFCFLTRLRAHARRGISVGHTRYRTFKKPKFFCIYTRRIKPAPGKP